MDGRPNGRKMDELFLRARQNSRKEMGCDFGGLERTVKMAPGW